MKVEEKVALCAIKHGEKSHIELDEAKCERCRARICLRVCPAQLYIEDPDSSGVLVDHTGCLECGTCLVVCPEGAVVWAYPEPGTGIRYRHG